MEAGAAEVHSRREFANLATNDRLFGDGLQSAPSRLCAPR